jgi:hypothetical protein
MDLTKVGREYLHSSQGKTKNSQANIIGHEFRLANDEKSLVISLSIGPALADHGGTVARFSESVLK